MTDTQTIRPLPGLWETSQGVCFVLLGNKQRLQRNLEKGKEICQKVRSDVHK